MTAVSALGAGARILAAAVAGIAPTAALKTTDQSSPASSTTLFNDSQLYLPSLPAYTSWLFFAFLEGVGAAQGSGDMKVAFTWPAGSTGKWMGIGLAASAAGTITQNPVITTSGSARGFGINGTTETGILIIGSLQLGATSGTLQTQWAENASSATVTTMKAGSFLAAWQQA